MKRKKLAAVSLLTLALAGCVFAACTQIGESGSYEDGGFDGGANPENAVLETDEFIAIDGKLDETVWENKNCFDFIYGSVRMRTTTVFGKLGFYIGATVTDPHVYASDLRDVWKGSSVEFYIDRGDAVAKTTQTFQYRLSAHNKVELLYGYVSPEDQWTNKYLPVYGLTTVQGELNSGNTEGMTAEVFVRWDALGYDYEAKDFTPPETVKIAPVYNQSSGALSSDPREAWCNNGGDYNNPEYYWQFGGNGFLLADGAEAKIGDADFGRVKSPGWELDKEPDGEVTSNYGGEQSIYFKDLYAENYMFTVKASFNGALSTTNFPSGDPYPKGGIILAAGDTVWNYLIDYNAGEIESENTYGMFFHRGNPDPRDLWALETGDLLNGMADNKKEIRFTGVKYGTSLLVFVGGDDAGKFGGTLAVYKEVPEMDGAASPGFFSMGCSMTFSDYEATTDVGAIEERLQGSFVRTEVKQKPGGALSGYRSGYKSNETAVFTVETYDGYFLTSVLVNGVEKIGEIENGELAVVMTGNTVVVEPVFAPVTVPRHTVTGKINFPQNVVNSHVTLFIKKTSDNSIAYRTVPAANGVWQAVLADGDYICEVGFKNIGSKRFAFTVAGADVSVPETAFNVAEFDDAGGVTYHEDGSVTLAAQASKTLKNVQTNDGFAISYSLERTDGVFDVSGTWSTGGLLVAQGGESFRIFMMRVDSSAMAIYFNRYTGSWQSAEYRVAYNYAGTGAPMSVTVAYCDGGYYFLVDGVFFTKIDASTVRYTGDKISDAVFSSGTRRFGLCAVDVPINFSEITFSTGDAAAQKAIDGMRSSIEINKPEHGTISLSEENPYKGENVTITLVPADNYQVASFIVDGEEKKDLLKPAPEGDALIYILENVTKNAQVEVTFEPIPSKYAVTGTYSYATGLYADGDTVTVSSGIYTGTAANGAFRIDLPNGIHTLTFTSARYRDVTLSVTVDGEAVTFGDAEFTAIKYGNENNLIYNEDGSVTSVNAADWSFWNFAGVSAPEGFTVKFSLERTDGVFDRDGTWETGGLGIEVGDTVYYIFVMASRNDGTMIYLSDSRTNKEYRVGGNYAGTGAPITITAAFYNGEIHLFFEGAHHVLNAANTQMADYNPVFGSSEKSIGLIKIGANIKFSEVSYGIGNKAAQKAIEEMKAMVIVNTPEHGTISVANENPYKGESVTVTIACEEGYEVDSFTVAGVEKKSELKPAGNGSFTYTIVKVQDNVEVVVSFKPAPTSFMVTGTYSYAAGLYADGDTVTVSSGIYTGTAANGAFRIDLPNGIHTLTFTSARYRDVTLSVTVDGEAVTLGDAEFTAIKYGNEKGLTYNEDGSVTVDSYNTFWDFAGVSTSEGFAVQFSLERTDGNFTVDGTWETGGLGVKIGNTVYRIYVMAAKQFGTMIYLGVDNGALKEYRVGGNYAGTGAPITITAAFYNGEIHLFFEGAHHVLNIANTGVDGLNEVFGDAEKSIGLIEIGTGLKFSNVSYAIGNAAAQKAIAEMEK